MITISACMIVKNEEKILKRCLDSIRDIVDELIIVDTGSTDRTKEIALEYTSKVFDFKWVDDFAAARNYSFSLATMDYIYMPDADEVLDEENRLRFKNLKEVLMPEVEIVEMRYVNQLQNGTVYNFDAEYRPKLFKRTRNFTFIDPIHEMVRLDPVVYESDIDICHMPETVHAKRDLDIFRKAIEKDGTISNRLIGMYARELLVSGDDKDLKKAMEFFENEAETSEDEDIRKISYIIVSKAALLKKDTAKLLKYSMKDVLEESSSEMCTILGQFYEEMKDYKEAAVWYYNARYETEAELNIKYKEEYPLKGLIRVYKALGEEQTVKSYEEELAKMDIK